MPFTLIADEEEDVVSAPGTNAVTLPPGRSVTLPPQFTTEQSLQNQMVTGAGESYFAAQKQAADEEAQRLAQEEAIWQAAVHDPANQYIRQPTLRERIRGSEPVTRLLGPVPMEREVQREMGLGTGSPGEIAETALKFTGTAPPPIADPIRRVTEPAINLIPNETARGIARGGRELAMSLPGIVASGGILPSNPAVLAAFAGQAVWQLPDQKEAFDRARKAGNDAEAAQIATETFGMGALLTGGAAHGAFEGRVRPPVSDPSFAQDVALQLTNPRFAQREIVLPKSMEEAARPPAMPEPTPVESDAPSPDQLKRIQSLEMKVQGELSKRGSEAPGDALLSVTEGRDVSPERYEAGLQKMLDAFEAESKAQVKGELPEPAAAVEKATVPVAETKLATSAESPLPERFTSKPVAEIADLVKDATSEEITALGGPTGFMWEIGRRAKTPEDVAALKKMAEDAYARIDEIKAEGKTQTDPDKAMDKLMEAARVAGKQPWEAYEYATGVKLDGTPKWTVLEKLEGYKGKTYTPPVPDAQYLKAKGESAPEAAKPMESAEPGAPRGIAAAAREPGALGGGEAGAISLAPIQNFVSKAAPAVRASADYVRRVAEGTVDTVKEARTTERMTDYRRSVLNWSAKLQKSFDEAARSQKDIQTRVPKEADRIGITDWIEAGGDSAVLRQRLAATADPKLKAGYQAALNLSPEALAVARSVKQMYDNYAQRGQANDVLKNFKDNYVTHIWDLGKSRPGGSSSRTLKERFKYSKARTFDTFFAGEQAGYAAKTKDISKLLPIYMHEMNSVIAARQLVQQMSKGRASDGRPLIAQRGGGQTVQGPSTGPTLVAPKKIKGDTADYLTLENQPAFQDWVWATKDSAGNPVFVKSDLALHPEAQAKLKNVLGKSAIREWYTSEGSRVGAIPKKLVHGLDIANAETKRTMLGALAPFHQVQTGTHAIGHRVNPFSNIPKVDLVNDRGQMDAAQHGLMLLPDRASEAQFMEGFKTSGLISRVPGLGPLSDMYSNYLFKQYIPGLKYKTYQAILERNNKVYADELASRQVRPEDIKVLSAEQANAAYGHLNYADLARNPTIQHFLQIGLLAPDFLEARGRFTAQALKGATGAKVGREQMIALGALALTQAASSFTAAKLTGGEWDWDKPFEFRHGTRTYTMRSVPEDISALMHNFRGFWHARLSPIVGKGGLQYATGVDYAGRRVSAADTTKELLTQPIPMTMRNLPGIRKLSGADRPGAIDPLEQLAGSVGLKISRYNPREKINELHADWMKNSTDPKVKADYEQAQTATYPISKYKSLDAALSDRNQAKAIEAINDLIVEGQTPKDITTRMRPTAGEGINARLKPLFHESYKHEADFKRSLTPEQLEEYKLAQEERRLAYKEFLKAWKKRDRKTPAAPPSAEPEKPPPFQLLPVQ